jgi:hypothetical protein
LLEQHACEAADLESRLRAEAMAKRDALRERLCEWTEFEAGWRFFCGSNGELTQKLGFLGQCATGILLAGNLP